MPDLLWPIKWVIELILVTFHNIWTFIGFGPDSGLTWVLTVIGLVLIVRAALIPVFVRQIKSQRNMMLVQPELKKLQNKYKGKSDRDSREKFAREQMDLYKRTGSNPLSSCLPLLLQMPIFMGLFFVINDAQNNRSGVGLLNAELAESFREASFLSAKLSATFISTFDESFEGESVWAVRILAAVMVVLMSASQFITQKQIMAKNQNPDTQNSQFMQTQKILLYVLPFVFLISGVSFPLALVTYWLSSNIWTMGQQFIVIRSMPTPGSIAYKERQDRLAKKGKLKIEEGTTEEEAEPEKPVGQRPQPKKKPKRKKKK
ncbi:MAG: membrane protein insertase YidC [Microbacteriaceae bacterium]|nr:membrane protein insertase YidC [Microbacteriaceae bacterium]